MINSNFVFNFINFCVITSFLTKSLVSVVLILLTLSTNSLHSVFLTISFFTASLSLLKSTGAGTNLSTSNLSTLLFKLLKLVGTFFSLSISNLSTLDFKLAKSTFLAKDDVSIPVAFFKSFLLHN